MKSSSVGRFTIGDSWLPVGRFDGYGSSMVVIVDDNKDVAEALALLLTMEGVPTRFVCDPKKAIGLIEAVKPVLVVMDQSMPGMKGTDVLREIRRKDDISYVPTIFFSAGIEGRDEAEQLGALDWISKTQGVRSMQRKIVDQYRSLANAHAWEE